MSILRPDRRRGRNARNLSFQLAPLGPESAEWIDLDRRLEPGHLARLISRSLRLLDLGRLWRLYASFGSPAYPPHLLLAVVLFETQRGHHCPAQWHRHANESIPVRWLLRGLTPSRACWYQFRDRLGPEMLGLAQQVVRAAIADGFTTAERAAIDGTLLAANASRHELLGQAALEQRCVLLREAVAGDQRGVPPQAAPGWLAATLAGRRQQAKRYAKASEEMARRQNLNGQKRASKRTPKENMRISAGDPEAALGRDKEKVFRPLYNVQMLDDLDSPLILGWQVVAQPNDAGLLGGVLRQAKAGLGVSVEEVVADAGSAGGADLAEARALGATVYAPWQANDYSGPKAGKYYAKERFEWQPGQNAYLCPQGQRLPLKRSSQQKRSSTRRIELQMYQGDERTCGRFAAREECTPGKGARTISRSEYEEHLEELRERMKGEEARRLYKRRKQTVELANADLKEHRGSRRLSGRGQKRAEAQVGLTVLANNLVALDGSRRRRKERATVVTPCLPDP